jgi:membrane protein required for beta-lactamase induction
MTLVTVLLTLFLDRMLFFHRDSTVSQWFARYTEGMVARLPTGMDGTGGVAVIVLPPAVAMLLLQWAVAPWLFGLATMVLGVLVLLFSLGPLDVVNLAEDYVEADRLDDAERTRWYYEQLTGEEPPARPQEEGRRMAAAVLYQGHDNLFATVFWFCLLGPAGAVLYRVAAEAALAPGERMRGRPSLLRAAHFVAGVLGWIPARLIAFGYAMTGSFEEALGRFRHGFHTTEDLLDANRRLLVDTGTAALRQDEAFPERDAETGPNEERRSARPGEVVDAARGLALRTAVLWLAVLALLTLGGWFG